MDPNGDHTPFGFLPCYKPAGTTSRDLVNRAQRRLRNEMGLRRLKVGHTGTLDPLAEGIVLLAIGTATRLTPWVLEHGKRYQADFRLGVSSESGDLETELISQANPSVPTCEELQDAMATLSGVIEQTPPVHSAIWVDGERAHFRARRGEALEMPTRRVFIESMELIEYDYPHLRMDVCCGSGTYLRTLGMDLAAACGCTAVMTRLVRTQVGRFTLDDAIDCGFMFDDNDREKLPAQPMLSTMRPATEALTHLPYLDIDADQVDELYAGVQIDGVPQPPPEPLSDRWIKSLTEVDTYERNTERTDCVAIDRNGSASPWGDLIAILRPKADRWHPLRVFPPTESITLRR